MELDQKEKDRRQGGGKAPAAEINRRTRIRPGVEAAIPEWDKAPDAVGDQVIGVVEADAAGGQPERSRCTIRMKTKRS